MTTGETVELLDDQGIGKSWAGAGKELLQKWIQEVTPCNGYQPHDERQPMFFPTE